ncbi:hypothetical protein [Cytobacillus firmus]|uniref:hypothetical protein n=1 Tax=Cytobacillus firmus TaxID=1399 RepID=UPI0018CF76E3|nr:hypothetical protein [Cytobacillus firmus]MED1908242.1 hypothetical protein [Cytobacillus firmus]
MDNTDQGKNASGKPHILNLENMESANKMAAKLLQDEQGVDIKSLFSMANKLIKDESFLNLVEDLGKNPQGEKEASGLSNIRDSEDNIDSVEPAILKEQIEVLKSDLAAIKKEVRKIKEQNASLLGLYLKVINAANQDFKKGINLITGISKLLK